MTSPTYDSCLVEAELRARAAYAEPARHYHGEEHLDDCLVQLETLSELGEVDRRLLRWAILWHDAVYDPGRSDNEDRSAELARRELTECGVAASDAEEVARLIRLTKGHRVDESDRLGRLLVSIDLSILGSDPEAYRDYVEAVRSEYVHLGDEEWRLAARPAGRRPHLPRPAISRPARSPCATEHEGRAHSPERGLTLPHR